MRLPARVKIDKTISEKEFLGMVVQVALLFGWKVYHTWNSIHSAVGYFDLVMVRGTRIIFAELKTEKGKMTTAQEMWAEVVKATGKCEVYLWRPSQWDELVEILR